MTQEEIQKYQSKAIKKIDYDTARIDVVELTQEQAETILQLQLLGLFQEWLVVCQGYDDVDDLNYTELVAEDDLEEVADGAYENYQLWRRVNA